MLRKILEAYGYRSEPKPEPENELRNDDGSPLVEGEDYDLFPVDPGSDNEYGGMGGQRYVRMSLRPEVKRTGFLSLETFERVSNAMEKYGIHHESALGVLSRMDANPSTDADRYDGKRYVNDILEGFSRREYALLHQGGDNFTSFLTNLKDAVEKSGGRDPVDLLRQFNRMSHDVRNCFTSEEQEAMCNKAWRAGTIEQVQSYYELRDARVALRSEATEKLGEDVMRHPHDHARSTGLGRVTQNGHQGVQRR